MFEPTYFFILAAISLGLVPLAHKMIALRIRILRAIHWGSMADWHQRNFTGFVLIARIIMGIMAVVLLALGLQRM